MGDLFWKDEDVCRNFTHFSVNFSNGSREVVVCEESEVRAGRSWLVCFSSAFDLTKTRTGGGLSSGSNGPLCTTHISVKPVPLPPDTPPLIVQTPSPFRVFRSQRGLPVECAIVKGGRLGRMVKKRKTEMDPSEDSNFFQSFVGAANAVSHMYTLALKEQRGASQAATRQTVERIAQWMDVQGGSEVIPKRALQELLNDEHMKAGGEGLYTRPQRVPQHNMEAVETASPAPSLSVPCSPWTQANQPHASSSCHSGMDASQFPGHFQGNPALGHMHHDQQGGFSFPQFGVPGVYDHHASLGRPQGPSSGS